MRIFLEATRFFLEDPRIFLEGTRFFLEQTKIFLEGTRFFLKQTKILLEETKMPLLTKMGTIMSQIFLGCFLSILFILALNEDIHKISNEFEFRPDRTTNYGVSCPWGIKKSHRLVLGKWCLHASSFIFERINIKVACNRHKSSDEFDFGPPVSMAHLYVFCYCCCCFFVVVVVFAFFFFVVVVVVVIFFNERMSSSACGWSKDLGFFRYMFDWPSFTKAFRFHQLGCWTRKCQ